MEPENTNAFFFRFEDLRVYNKALEYVKWVHVNTDSNKKDSEKNLSQWFNKAAQAIAVNIAEGSGRNRTQFIYYLKMAKSAIRECVVYTTILNRLDMLNETATEESRGQLIEITKMVGALIASLQRARVNSSAGEEEDDDEVDAKSNFNKY